MFTLFLPNEKKLTRYVLKFFFRNLSLTAFFLSITLTGHVFAQEIKFLGINVIAYNGTYLVTKSANVRAAPMTKSKKLGMIKSGAQVKVVGRAKGGAGWMAIQRDGKNFGFVYSPVLLPLIDGRLEKSYSGNASVVRGGACSYIFNFKGKNISEGENYFFSDYEITYLCKHGSETYKLLAAMFLSEIPIQLTQRAIFQISIDLMEVENGYDEIFSTTFEYRKKDKQLVFVGTSIKSFGKSPKENQRFVNDIVEALVAAVEIAPDAWGNKVWEQIRSK